MDEGKVNAVGFRKVRSMADRKEQLEVLSERLAEYVPTIPDELTEHCMAEVALEDYGVNLKTPQYFTDANANAEETGARTGKQ
eukprot:jgi/Pico_ML_1/54802/g665.t1